MPSKRSATFVTCLFSILIPGLAQDYTLSNSHLRQAEELYNEGRYDSSLSLLSRSATDAPSLFLMGRDYYMLGDFKKASRYIKKGATAAPETSEYLDWLGRAYERRAWTSNPLSAIVMVKNARQAFERAVQLNSKNAEALSDLFNYYLQAPAVLGGGYEKAESVAEKMSAVDPAQGFFEQLEAGSKAAPNPNARASAAIVASGQYAGGWHIARTVNHY